MVFSDTPISYSVIIKKDRQEWTGEKKGKSHAETFRTGD